MKKIVTLFVIVSTLLFACTTNKSSTVGVAGSSGVSGETSVGVCEAGSAGTAGTAGTAGVSTGGAVTGGKSVK
jgi:hypothetical protein